MILSNSNRPIDPDLPYVFGNTIGYGRPSNGTAGNYRGAYNLANQVLAHCTPEKIRWKFQYDFTTPQANSGTIRSVGLTYQYDGDARRMPQCAYKSVMLTESLYFPSDGRYLYGCSQGGVVTRYDLWNSGASFNIDVSATVGTAAFGKMVALGTNGKAYIIAMNSTRASQYIYEFSDATFTDYLGRYSLSNLLLSTSTIYPCYVHNGYVYACAGNEIYKYSVSGNTAHSIITPYNTDPVFTTEGWGGSGMQKTGTALSGTLILTVGYVYSDPREGNYIFDLATETSVAWVSGFTSQTSPMLHTPPNTTENKLWGRGYSDGFYHNNAIAAYILPTPITKTSAYAMTATYEVEVFW